MAKCARGDAEGVQDSIATNAFPSADTLILKAHIEDYSIHHDPVHSLLIGTFKYTGMLCYGAYSTISY